MFSSRAESSAGQVPVGQGQEAGEIGLCHGVKNEEILYFREEGQDVTYGAMGSRVFIITGR